MNEILIVFISGFSIGILGSFHCIGMCGPIALALPIHKLSDFNKYGAIGLYNLGRAFSYSLLGVLFGLLGFGFSFFKIQQLLSIGAGIFILMILLINRFGTVKSNGLNKFSYRIKNKLGHFLKSDKTLTTYFYIGFMNGFLPCGLVYVAIAAAISTGSILNSSFLMFSFGIGTLPVMASTMAFGKFISLGFRKNLNKVTPYLIMFLAVLLIIRGLNLGIPYFSPAQEKDKIDCCHK